MNSQKISNIHFYANRKTRNTLQSTSNFMSEKKYFDVRSKYKSANIFSS